MLLSSEKMENGFLILCYVSKRLKHCRKEIFDQSLYCTVQSNSFSQNIKKYICLKGYCVPSSFIVFQ